jgi:hypothetical protein
MTNHFSTSTPTRWGYDPDWVRDERGVPSRACSRCGKTTPADHLYLCDTADGVRLLCSECHGDDLLLADILALRRSFVDNLRDLLPATWQEWAAGAAWCALFLLGAWVVVCAMVAAGGQP